MSTPTLFFFKVFGYSDFFLFFAFHINSRIGLLTTTKYLAKILAGIALNLRIITESIDILRILSLPIYEHNTFVHFWEVFISSVYHTNTLSNLHILDKSNISQESGKRNTQQ